MSSAAECKLEGDRPGSRHQTYPPTSLFGESCAPSPANRWPSPFLATITRNLSSGMDTPTSFSPNLGVVAQPGSSSAGVFPPAIAQLQANFQQYYASLLHQGPAGMFVQQQQQHLMQQIMAASSAKYAQAAPSSTDLNGSIGGSESRASSTSDSTTAAAAAATTTHKRRLNKLQIDPDGNATCPVCEENMGSDPAQWSAHVEVEKERLIKSIENLKSHRNNQEWKESDNRRLSGTPPASSHQAGRTKRDFELARIRSNQQKRLQVKNLLVVSPSTRTNDGVVGNQNVLNSEPTARDTTNRGRKQQSQSCRVDGPVDNKSYCKGCQRHYEFLVISAGMGEETRCFSCFEQYRRQVGALPLTITQSPTEDIKEGEEGKMLTNGKSSSSPPKSNCETRNSEEVRGALKLKLRNEAFVQEAHMDHLVTPQKRLRLVKEESEKSVAI